MTGQLIIIR